MLTKIFDFYISYHAQVASTIGIVFHTIQFYLTIKHIINK